MLWKLKTIIMQGYKHIFTSPSSVEKEPKATRSGNARIHGMTQVTPASIAYIATQVLNSPGSNLCCTADHCLCRYGSHSHHRLYFPGPTLWPIRRGFIIQSLIFLTTSRSKRRLMIFLCGGIGTFLWLTSSLMFWSAFCTLQTDFSKLFFRATSDLQE